MPLHSTHGWFQPCFGGSRKGQHQCSPRLTHLSPWPWLPPCIWGLQHPMAEAPPHHLPPGSGGAQSRSLSFSGGRWRLVVTQRSPAPSLPCAFLNLASAPSARASSTRTICWSHIHGCGERGPREVIKDLRGNLWSRQQEQALRKGEGLTSSKICSPSSPILLLPPHSTAANLPVHLSVHPQPPT